MSYKIVILKLCDETDVGIMRKWTYLKHKTNMHQTSHVSNTYCDHPLRKLLESGNASSSHAGGLRRHFLIQPQDPQPSLGVEYPILSPGRDV